MTIDMNAGQAAALAKLIRSQIAAYDEATGAEPARFEEEPFTGEDLDMLAPLLPWLVGTLPSNVIPLPRAPHHLPEAA